MHKFSFLIGCLLCLATTAFSQTISFVGASRTVSESAGTVLINLSLSASSTATASVEVFVAATNGLTGADFVLNTTTVTFPAGSTAPQSVTLNVTDDVFPEADEYIFLRMRNLSGATAGSTPTHLIQIVDNDKAAPIPTNALSLSLLTSYRNPTAGSAEIVSFDKDSKRLFIANSVGRRLDIVSFANPSTPSALTSIDISSLGNINSVAVRQGIVAVALEGLNPQANGAVAFYDVDGNFQKQVTVGAMPDMIGFSPDGRYVVTPDEGEPNSYTTGGVDPEGSVSIIDMAGGVAGLTQANVTTVGFTSLNGQRDALRAAGVRIYGRAGNAANGSTVAQDLEPEYVAFSPDSRFAYVTLQENNALAVIDLTTKSLAPNPIRSLGLKNHNTDANAFDPTDQGGVQTLQRLPVMGMYQPDAITSFVTGGQTYYITANEGDARDYTGLSEEVRVGASSYVLDPTVFPVAAELKNNLLLGRLTVSNATGDTDGDGDFDQIHVLGGRSFSIWNSEGALVYDSGDDIERYTRSVSPALFNINNSNTTAVTPKDRSDNKGPEPEGVTTAEFNGRQYAFVSLERVGGVMIYDVTNPTAPQFVSYTNNRSTTPNLNAEDRGAEGIIYIPAAESPNSQPLLVLANEISNSVSVYQISVAPPSQTVAGPLTILAPLYDCTTRQITFRGSSLLGAPIPVEYMAVGVTGWTTNPVAVIEAGVVGDQNNSTITIMARQGGIMATPFVFNFRQACNTPTPQPSSLVIQPPLYNCATRQLTFRSSSLLTVAIPVEYMAVGVRDWSTDPIAVIEAPVVADRNNSTITIMARQQGMGGAVAQPFVFNFRQACAGARIANEAANVLTVNVLGNPTTNEFVTVAVQGAENNPLVLNVVNEQGMAVSTQFVERATTTERQTLKLGRVPGVYLIQAVTPTRSQTVKVVKQ
ncbi:MAG: T9SS C-terminal target domain-containing protein [Cytophagales bacterium]|nr:MAG: T9SS C-terminal target domain-containing protein [Cytophagales bacterium]